MSTVFHYGNCFLITQNQIYFVYEQNQSFLSLTGKYIEGFHYFQKIQ